MNVLLIGGSGYLGYQVGTILIQDGVVVFNHDKKASFYHANPVVSLYQCFRKYKYVIFMASSFDTGDNLELLQAGINLCNRHGVHFIYVSSGGVVNIQESNQYIASKRESESIVSSQCNEWTIIRPASMYGLSNPVNWVSLPMSMLKDALIKKQIDIKHPNEMRPVVHVRDVAKIIRKVMYNKEHNRAYNVSTENYSKIEIAKIIKDLLPKTTLHTEGDPAREGYTVSKSAFKTLGVLNYTLLADGLKEVMNAKVL